MRSRCATLFFVVVLVCACGGGGGSGGTSTPPGTTVQAVNVPEMSGYIHNTPGGAVVEPSTVDLVAVGDEVNDQAACGYYRFNIAMIPPGATILAATFTVGQHMVLGNPYIDLGGDIVIDHVNLGAALDPTDLTAPNVLAWWYTQMSQMSGGYVQADLTSAVQADVNAGRTRTDLMLHFPGNTDSDGQADYVQLNNLADHSGSGLVPRLTIRFLAP